MKLSVKEIALLPILAVIVFLQEELLVFLLNINLTVFLLVLFSKKFGSVKSATIIIIYCTLDNIFMSSFNLLYTPFMYAGWLLIPLLLNTVFKNINSSTGLALCGVLFSFIYCWMFFIPNVLILGMNFFAYFMSDIIYETILAFGSFISILWLYQPCSNAIDRISGRL